MDFITDLPISNRFDSIFIVVNQGLSKGVILMPCNKMINAEETAKLYINNVFIQYGLADIMISNRGPQFTSNFFNGIMNALGMDHRMSTAFHPQTDGQTEHLILQIAVGLLQLRIGVAFVFLILSLLFLSVDSVGHVLLSLIEWLSFLHFLLRIVCH
jgi:hypothetical protein